MKIYCSGIGGIGLSAYAALQKHAGHIVSGSDRSESALIEDLRSQGIDVSLDQTGAAVPADADLLVYSEALPPEHSERKKATELGIRQISYPAAVGEMSKGTKLICVCGTHGKSSTTGMAARLLIEAGLDPTIIVGTKLRELDGRNWRKGKSDLFLLEACEYKHSFHNYHPSIILLTNCDGDHFDFYKSIEDYRNSFVTFVKKLPADGILITHLADPDCKIIAEASGKTTIDADTQPVIRLKTPGAHMRGNAQLVLSLAEELGIDSQKAQTIISGYAGSWRRIELRGTTVHGIPVIDDYGHHPKEIRATLAALREEYPGHRLICVFQPHTHDRTMKLYDDFTRSFSDADVVIIPDIYDARKHADTETVDVKKLLDGIVSSSNVEGHEGVTLEKTEDMIRDLMKKGDLLVFMGAGNITNLAGKFIQ